MPRSINVPGGLASRYERGRLTSTRLRPRRRSLTCEGLPRVLEEWCNGTVHDLCLPKRQVSAGSQANAGCPLDACGCSSRRFVGSEGIILGVDDHTRDVDPLKGRIADLGVRQEGIGARLRHPVQPANPLAPVTALEDVVAHEDAWAVASIGVLNRPETRLDCPVAARQGHHLRSSRIEGSGPDGVAQKLSGRREASSRSRVRWRVASRLAIRTHISFGTDSRSGDDPWVLRDDRRDGG